MRLVDRVVKQAFCNQSDGEVVVGFGGIWSEAQGFLQMTNRLIRLTTVEQGETKIVDFVATKN